MGSEPGSMLAAPREKHLIPSTGAGARVFGEPPPWLPQQPLTISSASEYEENRIIHDQDDSLMVAIIGTPKLVAASRKSMEHFEEIAGDTTRWEVERYRLVHLLCDLEKDRDFWNTELMGNSSYATNQPVCVGSTVLIIRHDRKRLVFETDQRDSTDRLNGPFTRNQIELVIRAAMKETSGKVEIDSSFYTDPNGCMYMPRYDE